MPPDPASPEYRELKRTYSIALMVWGVLATTPITVWFVVKVILQQARPTNVPTAHVDHLRIVFYAASVGVFLTTLLLRKILAGTHEVSLAPEIRRRKLFAASVVSCALSETPALLGFAFANMSHDPANLTPFLIISAAMFAIYFPRFAQWESIS